ncbi:hypothetical protein CC1G_06122 [Coprinopsis cinerea okayama7|uniref:Cytochrome P450 n=1 Tax=Coprinopsis cinerea (strain Okayama-7 / 130 / ATCC MYA-4618 / FGSC 9003) TaxID=240176 RepID=A8PA87_COPC7|nr:hypothetical protein CC1G_06122 [Coprinopsis cinerea okayama7\|eukprot:XP_001839932.1 hypothetical protein CC1G_06122 [Coprinopsis cinerea okayama7\
MLDWQSTSIVIAAFLLASLLCLIAISLNQESAVGHSSLGGIRQLFSPDGADVGTLLADRARPNQRLVRAFGITNTFVSPHPSVHRSFVTAARSLLSRANKRGWGTFRDISTQAIHVELSLARSGSVNYGIFIQAVTLRVILVGLLGANVPMEDFSPDDIYTAASHINKLWSLSKDPSPIPSHLLPELNDALRRLLPDITTFPNPVDIVIPAWETFWRVVATTVAYSHNSKAITQLFLDFYAYPTDNAFREANADANISPKNVVEESMRLQPPSKHIARKTIRPSLSKLPKPIANLLVRFLPRISWVKHYADVQAVLRSPAIWGSNSLEFNPWRHNQDPSSTLPSRAEALGYIFGGGNLRCIGSSWAPVAAAVVASAVFDAVDRGVCSIVPGRAVGGRNGWEDWSVTDTKN